MSVLDQFARTYRREAPPIVCLYERMRSDLPELDEITVLRAARSALSFLAASTAEEGGRGTADRAPHSLPNEGA